VGWSGEEYDPSATTPSATAPTLTGTEVFVQSAVENVLGVVNPKAFTTLYDNLIEVNSQISDVQDGENSRFVIPLNQKFKYQSAGGKYGKTKNLYYCIIAKFLGPVSPATNINTLLGSVVLNYTDA